MSRNIPEITIAQVMNFNSAGMPDNMQYEIAAIIDTPDEMSHLGCIRFEDAADLVSLHKILGNYIRAEKLNVADQEQEGGDK